MQKGQTNNAGFTLLELLITLVIAAILASFAVPSFTGIIKNNLMAIQYNELLTNINLTRSEAIKRGTDVKILSNNNANWEGGWIVYDDTDNDNIPDDTEIIRITSPVSSSITIKFNNGRKITYHSTGLAGTAGTFTFCDDRTDPEYHAKALIINSVGRARAAIDSNNDGIVESGNDDNVSCSL